MATELHELIRFARAMGKTQVIIANGKPMLVGPWWQCGLQNDIRKSLVVKKESKEEKK